MSPIERLKAFSVRSIEVRRRPRGISADYFCPRFLRRPFSADVNVQDFELSRRRRAFGNLIERGPQLGEQFLTVDIFGDAESFVAAPAIEQNQSVKGFPFVAKLVEVLAAVEHLRGLLPFALKL
jgi:hypothetical protein